MCCKVRTWQWVDMLSAILPILWEVLKIHFSADVPRPRTSLIDGLGTSQRGTLCISFTLHIYYNIFFLKNQICYIYLVSRRSFFDLTLLYPSELHPSYQGTEVPLSSHLRHLARWGKGGWTRTNDLRHHKLVIIAVTVFFTMEKVVWRKKAIRAYHFLYLTYIL